MRRFILPVVCLAILVALCAPSLAKAPAKRPPALPVKAQPAAPPPFALVPGTVWIYEGDGIEWDGERQREVKRAYRHEVTLEAVTPLSGMPGFALLRFRGFFDGPAAEGEPPESCLLVLKPGGLYRADESLAHDPARCADAVGAADLFLKLPLKKGIRFGDPEMIALHPPGRYSWLAESVFRFDRATVRGAGTGKAKGFRLVHRTNPDHQALDFVPGVGVTRMEYAHHGTPSSYLLILKEIRDPMMNREPVRRR